MFCILLLLCFNLQTSGQTCQSCATDIDKVLKETFACKSDANKTIGLAVSVVNSDQVDVKCVFNSRQLSNFITFQSQLKDVFIFVEDIQRYLILLCIQLQRFTMSAFLITYFFNCNFEIIRRICVLLLKLCSSNIFKKHQPKYDFRLPLQLLFTNIFVAKKYTE